MPQTRKKLLITGAGGFLGSHLIRSAGNNMEVFGTSLNSDVSYPGVMKMSVDLSGKKEVDDLLQSIQPDFIVHAAAVSGESACRNDALYAHKVNVQCVDWISAWAEANHSRLIFTSTDLVFDGQSGNYSEDSIRHSEMAYGQLKIEAENLLFNSSALIVRLPLLYGIGYGNRKGLMWNFIRDNRQGKEQKIFTDEWRSPALVNDVADFVIELLKMDIKGTLHLGGPRRLSRYEIAMSFIRGLHLSGDRVKPIKRIDIDMSYRPADTSLNSARALGLGYVPQPIEEALRAIKNSTT